MSNGGLLRALVSSSRIRRDVARGPIQGQDYDQGSGPGGDDKINPSSGYGEELGIGIDKGRRERSVLESRFIIMCVRKVTICAFLRNFRVFQWSREHQRRHVQIIGVRGYESIVIIAKRSRNWSVCRGGFIGAKFFDLDSLCRRPYPTMKLLLCVYVAQYQIVAEGGGGGGGSKESSYVSSEIGLPAFLAAAFLLKNQAPIFDVSTCLSAAHSRRELADGTRGSDDQRAKSSATTCCGNVVIGLEVGLCFSFWEFESFGCCET